MAYRLISGRRGRAFVSLEDKIKAIHEIFVKERSKESVLGPIYKKAGKELPENTSVVVQNWKKSIQDRLDKDDPYTIRLCKEHQIIEEVPDPAGSRNARPKKSRSTRRKKARS